MRFLNTVRNTIRDHSLLRKQGKVIVALSGGADSVALLSSLLSLGYDCVAAHCNFHLRGEESNRDMRHAMEIAGLLDVDLYIKEFDVRERMKSTGESIEMACRELRYRWFYDLLDRDGAQAIAVGHHREDQAETFFLNLLRGSGITGLSGMRYRSEHVVRPLLDVTRAEIEDYLREKGIDWIDDSSNASDKFTRNRIRHHLIPLLEEISPGAVGSILKTMKFLRETEEFYSNAVNDMAAKYVNSENEIDISRLVRNEPMADLILYEKLKKEGFNRTQARDIIEAAGNAGGIFRACKTHIRHLDHGTLRAPVAASPVCADATEVTLLRDIFQPVHIQISRHNVAEFRPERDARTAYIDASVLETPHTWQIRKWRRGDRMCPYGMSGTKLVSDIFAHARLSASQKDNAWLLTCDEKIVWVIGIRASSLFTVGPSTKKYLRLTLI